MTTQSETRNCSVFIFTETWLHNNIPDTAIWLQGRTLFRADRNTETSGKTRGGGLCVYINNDWCVNSSVVATHCSPQLEFLMVKCRPFYLPREFTAVMVVGVYIPPSANANEALRELYDTISGQQTAHPDGFFIVAGDFNHANLKTVAPKFYQHVNFATRGKNMLDLCYTNIRDSYKASPRPHLGYSDHLCVLLAPAYRPVVKRSRPVQKTIRVWPEGAVAALQDCFECTDWDMFKEAASYDQQTCLDEYTDSVTGYIEKCIEDVTVLRTVTTRANQKPWLTAETRALLRAKDAAFRSGDGRLLRVARAQLSKAIRKAKRMYAQKIYNHFCDAKDPRRMWQGIQALTDYKVTTQVNNSDAHLPDKLNNFYARFEAMNSTRAHKSTPTPEEQALHLDPADVRRTLSRVNPRKAAGPDNIPGRVLRDCADQLTGVFTDIYNISLSQAVVPASFKKAIIIPVPKKSVVTCLNDYRPVALTSILMKCFERLVKRHIHSSLSASLDPLQFAYRSNRTTDDAISYTLHSALSHLDTKDAYIRMLFIDFSSAFNTIIPQQLFSKLRLLGISTPTCNWILDFLIERTQSVRIGSRTSGSITLSTGAPQGCVLSPLLFTLLTHDCTAKFDTNLIIKLPMTQQWLASLVAITKPDTERRWNYC
nr:uncharacterized protein LOC129454148 [Misgurnus anguillicaudatus]